MNAYLLVAAGGGLGAVARFAVGQWAVAALPAGFPFATLIVNGVGGLLMGLLIGGPWGGDRALVLALGTGLLGGFTTFSAFALETVHLLERGALALAGLNILASMAIALGACALGLALARSL